MYDVRLHRTLWITSMETFYFIYFRFEVSVIVADDHYKAIASQPIATKQFAFLQYLNLRVY